MSVVESKREEGELRALTKARELAVYTISICCNENNFPKRYRWCITNKVVETALLINLYIEKANSVRLKNAAEVEIETRRKYQTIAIAETYAMTNLISISRDLFGLKGDKVEHWTRLVKSVRTLARAWKNSEK
jgi:hypothetical protein